MEITRPDPERQYQAVRLDYTGPRPRWDWEGIRTGDHPNKKRGLGSLDATTVLGLNRYKSKYALFLEIVGDIPKPPSAAYHTEIALVGSLLEDDVAELFRWRTDRTLVDRAYYKKNKDGSISRWDTRRHPQIEWMVGNLDLEILDPAHEFSSADERQPTPLPFKAEGNGVLEIKTKDYYDQLFDEDGLPTMEIQVQLQHLIAVSGFTWGTIAALVNRRLYWMDIQRSDEFIAYLVEQEEEFWQNCYQGKAPEIDEHEATAEALGKLHPEHTKGKSVLLSRGLSKTVSSRYDFIEAAIKEGENEKETIKNLIKFEMGDAEESRTDDGTERFTWKRQKDGEQKYTIKGKREITEEAQLLKMGAEYTPGKDGARVFKRSRKKKGKKV